jgi:cell division protein FtsW
MKLRTTWLIFLCTLALLTVGIVMVCSSSAAIAARELNKVKVEKQAGLPESGAIQLTTHSFFYLKRQAAWATLSIIGLLVAYRIDYEKYRKYATPLLIFSFLLLILVFVPGIGRERNGSHRWIGWGSFQIQASEVAKLALILYMAKKLSERQNDLRSFKRGFAPSLLILAIFLAAIVVEPDLGATVVIASIVFMMWLVAGMRWVHLATLGIAAVPAVVAAIIAEPYRVKRLLAFMDPAKDMYGTGWQLYQSLISVGSGGVTGLGLGNGPQKYLFLSEAYTDFIFAVICEETGMVGAIAVIALYFFFVVQGYRVAMRVPDMYGSLLATGITSMIGIQAFINMFVVTGLVPTKGLTLPLISYGGSSLLINMVAIGILMNLSRDAEIAAAPSRRAQLAPA